MDKGGKRRRRAAIILVLERAIGPDSVQYPESGRYGSVCFSLHIVLIVFLCDYLSFCVILGNMFSFYRHATV